VRQSELAAECASEWHLKDVPQLMMILCDDVDADDGDCATFPQERLLVMMTMTMNLER